MDVYRSSLSRCAADGESHRDAIGQFAHAANSESGRFAGDLKSATIVLDNELYRGLPIYKRKNKTVRERMTDSVGNGFLADTKKGVGDTQRKSPFAASTDGSDSNNRPGFDHAASAVFKSAKQPHGLQVLWTQRCNATASFFMTVPHHIAGYIKLRQNARFFAGFIVNSFESKAKAGEALRQCVMHLMSQAFTLLEHILKAPAFEEDIDGQSGEGKNQKADDKRNNVARAPPGRAFDDLDITEGRQKNCKRSKVVGIRLIDGADTAQTKTALVLQETEARCTAGATGDCQKGLTAIVKSQSQRTAGAGLLVHKTALDLDKFRRRGYSHRPEI